MDRDDGLVDLVQGLAVGVGVDLSGDGAVALGVGARGTELDRQLRAGLLDVQGVGDRPGDGQADPGADRGDGGDLALQALGRAVAHPLARALAAGPGDRFDALGQLRPEVAHRREDVEPH
ncbi:hypothetical protein [Pseudonocardia sp. D17]|uniref:hypothetical protein n=1 Tax=Pseudonocardia sp. D17 TaxID=882661 RepID=UPI0030CC07DC